MPIRPVKKPGTVPPSIILTGDTDKARMYLGFARDQLRILEKQMSFQGLNSGERKVSPQPGINVVATSSFSIRRVEVYAEPIPVEPKEKPEKEVPEEERPVGFVAMAHKWEWNSKNVYEVDQEGYLVDTERAATMSVDKLFYNGFIKRDGSIYLATESELVYPTTTQVPVPDYQYRVEDFTQVRYMIEKGKYYSLCMCDYSLHDGQGDAWFYRCVDIVGEGGLPSLSILVEDESIGVEKLFLDAAFSRDFTKLYVVETTRAFLYDPYQADVSYRVWTINEETGEWSGSGTVDVPTVLNYVYGSIQVDRDGFIGTFAMNSPGDVEETIHDGDDKDIILTYSPVDKYLYSIEDQAIVLTENQSFVSKVVDLNSLDYEIAVKSADVKKEVRIYDNIDYRTPQYVPGQGYLPGFGSYAETREGTIGGSLTFPYVGEVSAVATWRNHLEGYSFLNTYEYPPPNDGEFSEVATFETITFTGGGIFRYYLFDQPRSRISTIGASTCDFGYGGSMGSAVGNMIVENYQFTIQKKTDEARDSAGWAEDLVGDFYTIEQCYTSCNDTWCDNRWDYQVDWKSPWVYLWGCNPDTPLWEFATTDSHIPIINWGQRWHLLDVSYFQRKEYEAGNILYPPMHLTKGVVDIKNSFMSVDNETGASFCGMLIKSNNQPYSEFGRQVAIVPGENDTVEDPAYEWKVLMRYKGNLSDVTNVIANKYGTKLLTDVTPIEDPPVIYDDKYVPRWLLNPPEYTYLESFFGIMFQTIV